MRFLSLFSGIGGFDLGLERAGMTCVGQVEYNPFCQKVLKKHWSNVKLMGDIHEVTGTEFGDIDLVCGGFPCQPFSTAGKRKGTDDNRYLWPEMLRIIEVAKPSWVIGENVAGIVNMALDQVCSELEAKGFEVWPLIIPAAAINAPHRRDRVWILAYSASNRREWYGQASEAEKGLQSEPGYAGELSGRPERLCENVTHAISLNDDSGRHGASPIFRERPEPPEVCGSKEDVANAINAGLQRPERSGTSCENERASRSVAECGCAIGSNWTTEPNVGRVAHGVSNRVDRLKSLGNAVVPQIVEILGTAIQRTSCAQPRTSYNTGLTPLRSMPDGELK